MTLNNFLMKFFLTVAFVIMIVSGIAHFNNRQTDIDEPTSISPSQEKLLSEQNTKDEIDSATASQEKMIMDTPDPGPATEKNAIAKRDLYLSEEYPLPRTENGLIKEITSNDGIIITTASNEDLRAIITPVTEIFKDAKLTALSDIKESDTATIVGRGKTADGDEFIADLIYISAPLNNSSPDLAPSE